MVPSCDFAYFPATGYQNDYAPTKMIRIGSFQDFLITIMLMSASTGNRVPRRSLTQIWPQQSFTMSQCVPEVLDCSETLQLPGRTSRQAKVRFARHPTSGGKSSFRLSGL